MAAYTGGFDVFVEEHIAIRYLCVVTLANDNGPTCNSGHAQPMGRLNHPLNLLRYTVRFVTRGSTLYLLIKKRGYDYKIK